MDQPADLGLQLAVADCLRLANEQRQLGGKFLPSLDQPRYRRCEVFQMEEGLPGAQVARIDMSRRVLLVDPRNLVGEKSRMA